MLLIVSFLSAGLRRLVCTVLFTASSAVPVWSSRSSLSVCVACGSLGCVCPGFGLVLILLFVLFHFSAFSVQPPFPALRRGESAGRLTCLLSRQPQLFTPFLLLLFCHASLSAFFPLPVGSVATGPAPSVGSASLLWLPTVPWRPPLRPCSSLHLCSRFRASPSHPRQFHVFHVLLPCFAIYSRFSRFTSRLPFLVSLLCRHCFPALRCAFVLYAFVPARFPNRCGLRVLLLQGRGLLSRFHLCGCLTDGPVAHTHRPTLFPFPALPPLRRSSPH